MTGIGPAHRVRANGMMQSTSALKYPRVASLAGPAVWAAGKARVAQWDRRAINPHPVQLATLLAHCQTAADTEFGRAHRLGTVRSYDDFRERVPLRTYADFEPYINRMRQGATDVLWPGLIKYFGMSSGTSNTAAKNKYLPITDTQLSLTRRAGFDLVSRYTSLTGDLAFTSGYVLALLPPSRLKHEGPVAVISNPGLIARTMPKISKLWVLPQLPIRDIEDYDKKLTAMAEAYIDHDVRAMTGTTCWFSVLFDRVLEVARSRGRNVDTVSQLWPNLSVLFGGGVQAAPYREIINARVGRPVVLIDNYNATEGGILACTDRLGDDSLLMLPDRGVFFEFVPREEHGKPDARRFPLWRVEPGVEYSVNVSTCSGLFAYSLGDFVRFTSVFPHRMVFTGRASGVLSVTQELTTNIEIERAVREASSAQRCTIVDFGAAADVGVNASALGRYVFLVEFETDPEDLEGFARVVDRELCTQNRVYREHRAKDVAILPPQVIPLAKGATRKFMEALGQHSVQQKYPRILDDRRRDLLRVPSRAMRARMA